MKQQKRKNSDPRVNLSNPMNKKQQQKKKSDENLANSLRKRKKSDDESTDPNGNLASLLIKKQKKSDANSSKKRKKSDEGSNPNGNLANPLKKKQKESDGSSNKANIFNQITIREADMPQRFNLSRCRLNRKLALTPHRFCKGKSIMEPSNNTIELADTVDQAIGIFHEEILVEILVRLPVVSLLRSKCVSKSWKALISDPYFMRKHLNHTQNDQNFQKLIVARIRLYSFDKCTFYCSSLSSVQLIEDEGKLDFPRNWKPRGCFTLCCCDGLVLLALYEECDDPTSEHLLLWNPSTRESIELPCPKSPLKHCVFGMGYDTTIDDYKILAVDLNERKSNNVSCEILALKGGSWRVSMYLSVVCRMHGYGDSGMDSLAFLHGAFHWVGWTYYYTILSFNISNEKRGEIPLLDRMLYKSNNYIEHGVSILGGMLCFYSTYKTEVEGPGTLLGGTFMLWVMKDYGVKESWTLLHTIQDTNLFSSARPKYRYADGEVLLRCEHVSRLGSVYRTSSGPFGLWPGDHFATREAVYTESLISPKLALLS